MGLARSDIHGRFLLPAVYSMMGDARFRVLGELLERDHWTVGQIREHQARRLGNLLSVSGQHNPYWIEKFQEYHVNPQGSDPFAELAKLPILTKDELRANWKRMRSTHLADREVVRETSSGSTGMPINIYQSRGYRVIDAAMTYRAWSWMGVRPGEAYLSVSANRSLPTAGKRFLRQFRLLLERGMLINAYSIDPIQVRRELERAFRRRPALISGYASSVATIGRIARDMGLDWSFVRAVTTTSECLFDPDREMLGRVFGAPVYDRYGSREVTGIATQCREGNHHVFADINIVEFVPLTEADEKLDAIVVTPLENEATPLFRYRNGDSASAVAGACACGRCLPLMTACRGRICNNFLMPDGRIVNGLYFNLYFFSREGFSSFQFHQTAVDHIDLYVVLDGSNDEASRAYLTECCANVERDLGHQVHVSLHTVDDIPKTPGGKHLYTISDVLKSY